MTPLHWAAYHGDPNLVKLFCERGALQTASDHGHRPVDIAGYCGKIKAVKKLAYNLALKVLHEETLVQKKHYYDTFDGRRILMKEKVSLNSQETKAFDKILEKKGGSRIHAYFAMK